MSGHNSTGRRAGWLAAGLALLLALALLAGGVLPAYAQELPPPIPHAFSGTVRLKGLPVPDGVLVEAFVNDNREAWTTVDRGAYYVVVPGLAGAEVRFKVGGRWAAQNATWESGKVEELNLTISEPPLGQYVLTISSTAGGSVIKPGEGVFVYIENTDVLLVAKPDEGYKFVRWTGNNVSTIFDVNAASTIITMLGNYEISANFEAIPANNNGDDIIPGLPCFIATAVYGSATAEEINVLREFRDVALLPNPLGAVLVSLYYGISPPIAELISRHEILRTAVRVAFVDLIVEVLYLTHDFWSGRG